ncbi:MAG: hypothetical protein Q9195_007831 [Heterodermia aff. obscurata]
MASKMLIRPLDFDVLKGTEWDLDKAWGLGSKIPGYRCSATFLSTLRTNIHLSTTDSIPSSPMVPPTTHSLLLNTKPSLLSITTDHQMSTPATTTDADPLPTLTTHTASTTAEKTAALKLIADSVAQQRQTAAKSILFHQYALAALVLVLALQAYWLSPIPLMTSAAGTIMIELVAVRYLTRGYIFAAETINWNWLLESPPTSSAGHSRSNSNSSNSGHKRGRSNTAEEPLIVVTKWADEVIGALVIRVSKRERKAYVRAWTVLRRYRGKGVGRSLLEEGVARVMGKAGVKGVDFDEDHANSLRILPPFLNAAFDTQEDRARDILDEVLTAQKSSHRRGS